MNKKQQIVDALNEGKEGEAEVPDDYQFLQYDNDAPINFHDWESVLLHSRDIEMLSIRMLKDTPGINIKAPSESGSHSIHEHASNEVSTGIDRLEDPSLAFLAWEMQDEFSRKEKAPLGDRIAKFLRAIHLKLPVPTEMTLKERRKRPQDESERRFQEVHEIKIDEQTFNDVEQQTRILTSHLDSDVKDLLQQCKTLLAMYLPNEYVEGNTGNERSSTTVRVYWGAVGDLLSVSLSGNPSSILTGGQEAQNDEAELRTFSTMVAELIEKASNLHEGVRCLRPKSPAEAALLPQHRKLAGGVILLAAIVDSLGSIFNMFVEAARYINSSDRVGGIDSEPCKVAFYKREALHFLETARVQLIRESDNDDRDNRIGPVLTPEAISIALMERLADGVYRSGAIKLVDMYEECLEHLVSTDCT